MAKDNPTGNPPGTNQAAPGRGHRLDAAPNEFFVRFNSSLADDIRLLAADAEVTRVHALMLERAGLLGRGDAARIATELDNILERAEKGEIAWRDDLEDIHMNLEAQLTDALGELGRRVHTGRSRNDQVAAGFRIYLRAGLDDLAAQLRALRSLLIDRAAEHAASLMPGLTHLQPAQPVTLGHHLLAWNEMLERDSERLLDCRRRLNRSPLGAAALAGTPHPIDPAFTAAELGFDEPLRNSLDAVSDRDFAAELAFVCSLLCIHLSRFAEEVILWSAPRYGFALLPDEMSSSSSIMPQKRNPDLAELVRGRAGRPLGALNALLLLLKGQPLAYNKDNQEDKNHSFRALDTALDCCRAWELFMGRLEFDTQAMHTAAGEGFATATDLADRLVAGGLAFRDAHELVGRAVALAEESGVDLQGLSPEQWRGLDERFTPEITAGLTAENSVASRSHLGGTAPARVMLAVESARRRLQRES